MKLKGHRTSCRCVGCKPRLWRNPMRRLGHKRGCGCAVCSARRVNPRGRRRRRHRHVWSRAGFCVGCRADRFPVRGNPKGRRQRARRALLRAWRSPAQWRGVAMGDPSAVAKRADQLRHGVARRYDLNPAQFRRETRIPGAQQLTDLMKSMTTRKPTTERTIRNRSRFRHERLRPPRRFRRFRTISTNGHRVVVGWRGRRGGRAQAILHPRGENPKCYGCGKRVGFTGQWYCKACQAKLGRKNPGLAAGLPEKIYDQVDEIRATKGPGSQDPGGRYFHTFASKPDDYALPNGTVIVTPAGSFAPAEGSALLTTSLTPVNGSNPRRRRRRQARRRRARR